MGTAPPILQEPENMGTLVGVRQKPGQKVNFISLYLFPFAFMIVTYLWSSMTNQTLPKQYCN